MYVLYFKVLHFIFPESQGHRFFLNYFMSQNKKSEKYWQKNMQMLKMLGPAWEPSPPWKLSGSGFLANGLHVAFLGEKSLARDLSTSARNAVPAIIHAHGGVAGGVG